MKKKLFNINNNVNNFLCELLKTEKQNEKK